jgi:hypothetical protein
LGGAIRAFSLGCERLGDGPGIAGAMGVRVEALLSGVVIASRLS